jgi:hypothetical protein
MTLYKKHLAQLEGARCSVAINNDKIKQSYSERGNIRRDISGVETLKTEEEELRFLERFLWMNAIAAFIIGVILCTILVHFWL